MKSRIALLLLLLGVLPIAFACKMTPFNASKTALTAIINQLNADNEEREIKKIRRIKAKESEWAYLVETMDDSKNCHAIAYAVSFEPSCEVKLQKLYEHSHC